MGFEMFSCQKKVVCVSSEMSKNDFDRFCFSVTIIRDSTLISSDRNKAK